MFLPTTRWPPRWTTDQIALALDLASKLPRKPDALEKGEIDLYKVRVLYDKTVPLSADLAAQVEERVLAKASEQTGAQMRQLTRRVVMRVDPEGHQARAEERKKQRCTGIDAMEEDMARFWAYLPAHLVTACYARVDAIARQSKTPTDPRTLDQMRADVVADLILATPDKSSAVKVELYAAVSAATLMGVSEQPGELAGDPLGGGCSPTPSPTRRWSSARPLVARPPPCAGSSGPATAPAGFPDAPARRTTPTSTTQCSSRWVRLRRTTWVRLSAPSSREAPLSRAGSASAARPERPTAANRNQCWATRHRSRATAYAI